jgi:hypothetical protein
MTTRDTRTETEAPRPASDGIPSLYLRDNLVLLAQHGDAAVEIPLTPPAALEFASMLIQEALRIARESAAARKQREANDATTTLPTRQH